MLSASMESEPSICIPIIKKMVSAADIVRGLRPYDLGVIDTVDLVWKDHEGGRFQQAFIHFKKWNEVSPTAAKVRTKLLRNEHVNLIHDHPWFWHCEKSHIPRPQNPWLRK